VTLFDQTAAGFAETSLDGHFTAVNDRYCEMVGRTRDELLRLSMQEITHPDDLPHNLELFDRAVHGGASFEIEKRYVRPDGSVIWVRNNVRLVRDDDGMPSGALAVAIDINAVKEAQHAAEEQTRILETVNRTGAAISGELNLQKVVQLVTDAAVELTGAQFGAFFYNVLDEQGESYMLYTLSGAEPSQFDFGMPRNTAVFHPTFSGEGTIRSNDITKDSRYGKNEPHYGMPRGHLPVRSYLAVPVVSRSGEVLGGLFFGHPQPGRFAEHHEHIMLGIASQAAVSIDNARLYQAVQRANETLEQRVHERTAELETANEALRQAQKMEAIGQLTGGIAHDFNNMLTVIRGSTDVLRRSDLDQEKRGRYLDAIADTADRAARLTGQLLAFARRQALRPETFEAAERVRSIAEMLRTVLGSRIKLDIRTDCTACFVEADASQFETAIVNMAVNARDAMDGEGRLSIEVLMTNALPAPLASDSTGPFVAVRVTDTGHGIVADDLEKIFEPFFTTKEVGKGTGLGLSQVYGFAKQSGGEIEVRSVSGEGATFIMYLPQVASESGTERPRREATERLARSGRILVVEDNREVGHFAEQVLADLGFEATLATSADEALRLFEGCDRFDVVFSDVVMPGMTGVEFAKLIRKRLPELPIVLTSGYSHVLAEESDHGFPLLHKPYSVDDLAKALAEALAD
jgi:PAS domain S-box-containing protein